MESASTATRTDPIGRFRIAAATYLVYGVLYLGGAILLVSRGIGVRGEPGAVGPLLWFLMGLVFVVLFPWLIWKAPVYRGCLWFTRALALLVFYRSYQVGRIAVEPGFESVPLTAGVEVSAAFGAWLFFTVTLTTGLVLAWASWRRF